MKIHAWQAVEDSAPAPALRLGAMLTAPIHTATNDAKTRDEEATVALHLQTGTSEAHATRQLATAATMEAKWRLSVSSPH